MTRNITVMAAATGVVAALLGGCASSGAARSAVASASASASARGAGSLPLEYAECMRGHGVPRFPNPVDGHVMLTPASGIDPAAPAVQAAEAACARYGPRGASAGSAAGGWRALAASLRAAAAAGQFSGSVLVARDGVPVLDAGYGFADRAAKVANIAQTRYCIASIGKLFTAVAIGQLAEQGRVAFDAPVGRYLPGLPPAIAGQVTIGELLDMTAGLGDAALSQASPPRSLAAMVALIARERLAFAPGARFAYSNDGYILLGAVVQRVSGESYPEYLQRHILGPAGLLHTGYAVYVPARVPGMAHGYAAAGSTLTDISGRPQLANPSGGAYSTVGDLLKFAVAVLGHRLLTPAMTATLLAPGSARRSPAARRSTTTATGSPPSSSTGSRSSATTAAPPATRASSTSTRAPAPWWWC